MSGKFPVSERGLFPSTLSLYEDSAPAVVRGLHLTLRPISRSVRYVRYSNGDNGAGRRPFDVRRVRW